MPVDPVALHGRRAALALLSAGLLAGCASRPLPRASTSATASDGAVTRRAPVAPVPPTQTPLALDPAAREAAVAQALLLINTPYTYGGNTPQGGFDCSGLMQYVFQQVGGAATRLPRSTAFSHMGLYVGGEQFVHAPSSGGTVRKDSLASRYFATRYQGARRVFAA